MRDMFPHAEDDRKTISFKCPRCNNLCGFLDQHAGKAARCTQCQCRFIIPDESKEVPELVKYEAYEPETGFFTSVFVRTWKTIINPESLEGLIFVMAAVCFEFFTRHSDYSVTLFGAFRLQLPLGQIIMFVSRGCLLWYYAEVITWTAMETESLPDIGIGTGFELIWNVIKYNYLFLVSLIIAIMPFAIVGAILKSLLGGLPIIDAAITLFASDADA